MKLILFLSALMIVAQSFAQSSVQPFAATVEFDNAQRPCIQVNLDPEPKTLKEAWKDYLKDHYDVKLKGIGFLTNKDLLSAEEIVVNQITSKEMDFYTQILQNENGSEMKLFVRLGYDVYLNEESFPNEYAALNEILESFIKFYIPKYIEDEIHDTEKAVSKLTDERDDLTRKIAHKSNEIVTLRKEIKEEEEELDTNQKALAITENKLAKRKEKLERTRTELRKL